MRKRSESHENHERWLVSYADFITLLFAFFVVLYATSSRNEEKEEKFEKSIRQEFKMPLAALMGATTQMPTGGGGIIDPLELMKARNITNEDLQESIEQLLDEKMSTIEKQEAISSIRHDQMGVRIALNANTFFPSGSAKPKIEALRSLDKIADVLKQTKFNLVVEGHTDDQPIASSTIDSNWELASLRATSILRYLIRVHKVSPERLAAISYADQKPIVANNSEENRAKNRRVELLIMNQQPIP